MFCAVDNFAVTCSNSIEVRQQFASDPILGQLRSTPAIRQVMKSLFIMSAKANAFSIAQLLDSTQADVQEYVSKRSCIGKCMTPQQIELELEGNITFSQ